MTAATIHEHPVTPKAPPGLNAPAPVAGSVTLSWMKPPLATTHDVRRAPHSLGSLQVFTVLATGIAGTSYTDTPGSGTWDYQVRAVNSRGPGPWSQPFTATV